MRFDPALPIASVALWLPPGRVSAADAVAAGLLDAGDAADNSYLAVSVSEDLAAPEMAVLAAGSALAAAGWDPATVDLVVHAWTYYQGHDFWSPPHFVARGIGAERALPLGVQQMCNGGAAAIEVAATRLLADPAVSRAVVTTADRFAGPGFDRWRGDRGAVYGDGATALLLASEPAEGAAAGPAGADGAAGTVGTAGADGAAEAAGPPFRLLAAVSFAAPRFEEMHRGADQFGPAARVAADRVSSRRTMERFFASGGGPVFAGVAVQAVHSVLGSALAEARLDGDDPGLRLVALPRLGATVLDGDYRALIAGHTGAAILDLGRETGHLGAGDAAANLAAIHAGGLLRPGELAILLSVGAGFTWSALAVQAM